MINKPNNEETGFSIVFTIINILNCKWVFENGFSSFKRNTMLGEVLRCLVVVPLEFTVIHFVRHSRIY